MTSLTAGWPLPRLPGVTQPPPPPGPPAPSSPLPIPYVEHHTGAKRVVVLTLVLPNRMVRKIPPVVGIDGRTYVVVWGRVAFEVPADRAVHVSVYLHGEYMVQAASTLLFPQHKGELTYTTDYLSGVANLA